MAIIVPLAGGFQVGVDPGTAAVGGGNLLSGGIGFRRVLGNFDPIAAGTPRECWGVSADGFAGWVDPNFTYLTSNIVPNGPAVFTANSATLSVFLRVGGVDYLRVDMSFTFAAPNVLRIAHTVTNISGAVRRVRFRRLVDWDVDPSFINDIVNFPAAPPGLPVELFSPANFNDGEHPSPLVAFVRAVTPPYTTPVVDDWGMGVQWDLGVMANGASRSFDCHYAINNATGQTVTQLRAQLAALGLTYAVTQRDNLYGIDDPATRGVAAMAFLPSGPCCPCSTGVTNPCCPTEAEAIPTILYAIITGVDCTCLDGVYPLIYAPYINQWVGGNFSPCPLPCDQDPLRGISMVLVCFITAFEIYLGEFSGPGSALLGTYSCRPFEVVFPGDAVASSGACCPAGQRVRVRVIA